MSIGPNTSGTSKLYLENVYATTSDIDAVAISSTNASGSIEGVKITSKAPHSSLYNGTGLKVVADTADRNIGIDALANDGGYSNYGVYSHALGNGYDTQKNVGVYGVSDSGTTGYGGFFTADGASTSNFGVYATASGTGAVAGYFDGVAKATAFTIISDSILKTNVTPLNNGLAIVNMLQPKTYDFRIADYPSMHLLNGTHAGVIAQDIEQVLPGVVSPSTQPAVYDNQGNIITPPVNYKGVNYIEIIPYLIAAIKEQQLEIQLLQAAPKPTVPNIDNMQQKTGAIEVKLSDNATVVLEQNNPNPFKDNTTITFNIPVDVKNAQILFYNSKGNVISTVDLTERGEGSLMVYGSDLTSGVYTYTLLVDGRVIETKKMMKIK